MDVGIGSGTGIQVGVWGSRAARKGGPRGPNPCCPEKQGTHPSELLTNPRCTQVQSHFRPAFQAGHAHARRHSLFVLAGVTMPPHMGQCREKSVVETAMTMTPIHCSPTWVVKLRRGRAEQGRVSRAGQVGPGGQRPAQLL